MAATLAAGAGIVIGQMYSASRFERSASVGHVGLQAQAINPLMWTALISVDSEHFAADSPLKEIGPEPFLSQIRPLLAQYHQDERQLPIRGQEILAGYGDSLDQVVNLIEQRRGPEAHPILDAATSAIGMASGELNVLSEEYEGEAKRVSVLTAISSAALYSAAILIIGMFFWRRGKSERLLTSAAAEQEVLRANEARFRSLIQNSTSIVTVLDSAGVIRYQSATVESTLGFAQTDLLHSPFVDLVHPEDQALAAAAIGETRLDSGVNHAFECRLRTNAGTWIQTEVIAQNLLEDPYVRGIVLTARDVGERKALEDQLTRQATHDPLTGLPNRLLFNDRLRHALERGMRSEWGRCHIVLFLDIDDFKTVNDSLGHEAGDEVLVAVAERLRASQRPRDTVARFGGDEFAILLENILVEDGGNVAERILETFREPFLVRDRSIQISVSIGVVFVNDGVDAEELIRDADTAMYTAKARGKGRQEIFTDAMHAAVVDRLDLEADLREGISEGQFSLYYQPVLDFSTRKMVGVEALLRWTHPTRGLLLPSDFIAMAEETGLILPLGAQVLREACKQTRQWQLRYYSEPPFFVTVNISGKQLMDPQLVSEVARDLAESGLPAASLVLEITETVLAKNTSSTIGRLQALRALGVQLAIDDFGTGYSSLSYLQQFPVDIIKIDKSFVDGISERSDTALPDAIVSLAKALRLRTVAEGVEHLEQIQHLASIGCDLWQGFYFAEPLKVADVESLLSNPAGVTLDTDTEQLKKAS